MININKILFFILVSGCLFAGCGLNPKQQDESSKVSAITTDTKQESTSDVSTVSGATKQQEKVVEEPKFLFDYDLLYNELFQIVSSEMMEGDVFTDMLDQNPARLQRALSNYQEVVEADEIHLPLFIHVTLDEIELMSKGCILGVNTKWSKGNCCEMFLRTPLDDDTDYLKEDVGFYVAAVPYSVSGTGFYLDVLFLAMTKERLIMKMCDAFKFMLVDSGTGYLNPKHTPVNYYFTYEEIFKCVYNDEPQVQKVFVEFMATMYFSFRELVEKNIDSNNIPDWNFVKMGSARFFR